MQKSNPFRSRPPDHLFDQHQNNYDLDFHLSAPIIQVEEEFVPFDVSKLANVPLPKQSTTRRHTLPTDSPFRMNPFFKSTATITDSGEIADDEYDDNDDDDEEEKEEEYQQRYEYDSNLFRNDRNRRRRRRRITSQPSFETKINDLSLNKNQTQKPSQINSSKCTTPSPTSVSYTGDEPNNNLMECCLKNKQQEPSTQSVLSPGTLRRTKRLAADEWEKSRLLNFGEMSCNINPPRRTLSAKAALQTVFRNTNDQDAS